MKTYEPHNSSLSGVSANIIAMICVLAVFLFRYVGLFICLALFFTEKYSGLVRYVSLQAAVLAVARAVVSTIVSFTSRVNRSLFRFGMFRWTGNWLLGLLQAAVVIGFIVLCVFLAVRSYRWQEWKIPVVSSLVDKLLQNAGPVLYNGEGPVPYEAQHASRRDPSQPYTPPSGAPPQTPPGASPYTPSGVPPQTPPGASPYTPSGAPPQTPPAAPQYTAPNAPPQAPLPGAPAPYPPQGTGGEQAIPPTNETHKE